MIREASKDLSDPTSFRMMIIDYGYSKLFDRKSEINILTPGIGIRQWQAPEMYDDEFWKKEQYSTCYNEKIDVWGVGVIYYVLLSSQYDMFEMDETRVRINDRHEREIWTLELPGR